MFDKPLLPISLAGHKQIQKADSEKLPALFANLVAEERTVNRQFLANKLARKGISARELLFLDGRELIGGLEIETEEIGEDSDLTETSLNLSGVQPKLSLNRGLVLQSQDEVGQSLVKFASPEYPGLVEVEFGCMTLAAELGFNVPQVDLVNAEQFGEAAKFIAKGETRGLRIERFDRLGREPGRIHCEDFAQIFGAQPEDKYKEYSHEHIGQSIAQHCPEDMIEYIQRLVFSVLIGNGDMHLKNWSIYYPDGTTPRLSPVYDFLSTILFQPRDDFALSLGGQRAFSKLDKRAFHKFGDTINLPSELIDQLLSVEVTRFLIAWGQLKNELFNPDHVQALDDHIGYHPLVQHFAPDLAPD